MSERKRYDRPIYTTKLYDWLRGFTLHVLTGFLAVGAHYAVMWLLVGSGIAAVPASSMGFVFGAATRFLLSYTKVFSPSDGIPVTLVRFIGALGLQFLANMVFLGGALRLGLDVWSAQVGTTVLLTFANYLVYRLWVFR